MKVKLEDIIDAIEFSDNDVEYFLDRETGEVVMISEMTMTPEEKEAACRALARIRDFHWRAEEEP